MKGPENDRERTTDIAQSKSACVGAPGARARAASHSALCALAALQIGPKHSRESSVLSRPGIRAGVQNSRGSCASHGLSSDEASPSSCKSSMASRWSHFEAAQASSSLNQRGGLESVFTCSEILAGTCKIVAPASTVCVAPTPRSPANSPISSGTSAFAPSFSAQALKAP